MMVQIMVMPYRRRMSSMRPIRRIKHVVDSSGVLTVTVSSTILASTVVTRTTPFSPVENEVGETINGMYISFYAIGSTGAPIDGPIDWFIAKARAGQTIGAGGEFPDPGDTGQSALRNQIFHEEKGLSGSGDGTPMVFKGVIAIPQGMRRMRESDRIFIQAKATGADTLNFCIKSIYKSYN